MNQKKNNVNTLKNLGLALATLLTVGAQAQEPATTSTSTEGTTSTNSYDKPVWSIGLSGVVIDDDGDSFGNLFNVGNSWHFLPFPTRLNVDMAISPNWSFEAAAAYSQLQDGKIYNGDTLVGDHMFFAFDVNAKYHFIKEPKTFDPYGAAGLGFAFRANLQDQTPTLNVGLGANIWFVPSFGLNLQTQAKIKMIGGSSSYMMHSAGLVYRFGK